MNTFMEAFASVFESILSLDFMLFFEVLAAAFQCLLCVDFILKFNEKTWQSSRFAFSALMVLSLWSVFSGRFLSDYRGVCVLVLIVLSVAFALTVCGRQYVQAIFSSSIFYVMALIAESLANALLSVFRSESLPPDGAAVDFTRVLYLVFTSVLLYGAQRLILHLFRNKKKADLQSGILTFAFTVTTVLGLGATMYLSELTKSTARVTPILLITLAFVLCNVLLYVLVDQMRHLQHRKYELRRLEEKIAAEKEQYEEAAVLWDNARILRHDMKQHFAVMLGQLEAGETEECKRYIQAVTSGIEASGRTVKTGTPILDYILSSRLAKAENVDVVLMGAVDTFDDIESSDLASLFGNILDNALEALAKIDGTHEKHLELLLSMHNSQRIIICKNTITESVLKSNKHLTSSKPDWESHGFGHRIILQIARKYHGTVDYFEEDGMFGVQVQIPLQRTPQANGEGL